MENIILVQAHGLWEARIEGREHMTGCGQTRLTAVTALLEMLYGDDA